MSGGDFTMNPFETLGGSDMSIRIDCDSFYEDPEAVDDLPNKKPIKDEYAVSDKKDSNEARFLCYLSLVWTLAELRLSAYISLLFIILHNSLYNSCHYYTLY